MMLSVIPMITKKSMEYTQSGMKSELNVSQQKKQLNTKDDNLRNEAQNGVTFVLQSQSVLQNIIPWTPQSVSSFEILLHQVDSGAYAFFVFF